MRDFFKEYREQKFKRNISIISFAFMFALCVNFLLFNTNIWSKLQTSVKNINQSSITEINKDIYLQSSATWSNIIFLKNSSSMASVSEIRLSLLFDPNSLKLTNFLSENKNAEIINISNIPWVVLLNIKYTNPINIEKNSDILKIVYDKTKEWKTNINLAETIFVSEKNLYELTNFWIEL